MMFSMLLSSSSEDTSSDTVTLGAADVFRLDSPEEVTPDPIVLTGDEGTLVTLPRW